jgi:uncharacterized membrane protein YphA (DoxX/SURF4 family)
MAAGVMLFAGLTKLRSPGAAQQSLGAFGLPPSPALARSVGATEAGIGGLCLFAPGEIARIALATAYLGLAVATGVRWLEGERESPCGCFGDASSRTHLGHVFLNLVFAAVGVTAVLVPPTGVVKILGEGPAALALLAGIGCSVYLTVVLLTLFPDSWRAYGAGEDA